jgi:TPR repeat protein
MTKPNLHIIYLVIVFTSLLSACYAPVIEGAQQGYDATRRAMLKHHDEPNSAAEEFKLGNTYCCKGGGPLNDLSIYDNTKATFWYCKSARQGYAPAQLQLARLYSGYAIRGVHIVLRASALVGTSETDFSSALMWAEIAANNKGEGDAEDARELRDEISKKVTDQERDISINLKENWRTAPCKWDEVILKRKT